MNQQSQLLPNNAFVFILASLPHIVLTTASMFTLEGGMTLLPTLLLMFGKEATNWIEKKPTLIHVNAGGDYSCCKRCQEHYFIFTFGKGPTNLPEKKSVPMHVNSAVENDLVFNVAKNITFLCLVTSQHIDLQNQRQSLSIKWVWFFLCISIILVLIGLLIAKTNNFHCPDLLRSHSHSTMDKLR